MQYLRSRFFMDQPRDTFNERLRQLVLLAIIIVLIAFIFFELKAFIPALLGAIIFYVLARKPMKYLTQTKKWPPGLAALLVMVISFLIILVPVFLFSHMIFSKVSDILSNPAPILKLLSDLNDTIKKNFGYSLLTPDTSKDIQGAFASAVPGILNQTLGILSNIVMMYFLLYFMLVSVGEFENGLRMFLPMEEENSQRLADELVQMTYSNAIGIPVIAITQAGMACLGYWIIGLPDPVFWGVLTGLASFLPVFGSATIWIPIAIWQIADSHAGRGLAVVAIGALFVGLGDNFLRMSILKRFADVHPLITLFGVILGLEYFGFPGLIFGPLLISYSIILVEIYQESYSSGAGQGKITPKGKKKKPSIVETGVKEIQKRLKK